jgi:prepilin-type N-terminal cleavage/methylation domain-containing protein
MVQNRTPATRSKKPGDDGFTLIEIIITIVVIAIAAVGVLSVFATGMRGSANPLLVAQATQLVQERMETIIGDRQNITRGFAWVAAADYNTNALKYTPENPITGFANFNRNVTIFCVTAAALNTPAGSPPCALGYAHVTVTVTNSTIGNVTAEMVITNY